VQQGARQDFRGADLVFSADGVDTSEGERPAAVSVHNGRVVDVGAPTERADVRIQDDCVLMPGLVDTHVHVNEPGRTEWEGFATATSAAAAGGVTTIVDMPLNSVPPTTTIAGLRTKQAAAQGGVHADTAFWGGAVPGNLDELRSLHEAGVAGFKCFLLPSGVDEFPPLDAGGLRAAMAAIADFGGLLIAHAEAGAEIGAPDDPTYRAFVESRPPEAETRAVGVLIDAARETGCRAHIVHLSAADALPLIASARADGLPITVETCPHYLTFVAEQIPDGATQFKCCPPIRGETNRELLWAGLRDGVIDCVVSDHSPCPPELKRGDFGSAWGGIASVQLGLSAVWTQAAQRGFSLADVARWMCAAPATLAGLATKGTIAPGFDADFAVFAPDETWIVDPARLRHRHPVTPYAGTTLRGVVRETWLHGTRVDGVTPRGRLLTRSAS
jgi:allantoinase